MCKHNGRPWSTTEHVNTSEMTQSVSYASSHSINLSTKSFLVNISLFINELRQGGRQTLKISKIIFNKK